MSKTLNSLPQVIERSENIAYCFPECTAELLERAPVRLEIPAEWEGVRSIPSSKLICRGCKPETSYGENALAWKRRNDKHLKGKCHGIILSQPYPWPVVS